MFKCTKIQMKHTIISKPMTNHLAFSQQNINTSIEENQRERSVLFAIYLTLTLVITPNPYYCEYT